MSPDYVIPGPIVFRIIALLLLYSAGALEINYQLSYYYPSIDLTGIYLRLYTFSFISIFTAITQNSDRLRLDIRIVAALFGACILLYLFSIAPALVVLHRILEQQLSRVHFIAHWLSGVIFTSVIFRLISIIRREKIKKEVLAFLTWFLCGVIVIFFSVELYLLSSRLFFNENTSLQDIQREYVKTCLPILWGLCSFAFMWLGMHFKFRTLRIVSLTLFLLTLMKLFIFDIRNISAGGKIAAFFCLGVLLLVVSFMYQRLKKIIIDNEKAG